MSVTMLRFLPAFLPAVFLSASVPRLAAGTLVEALTLCASITQADGHGVRLSLCRTNSLSRPLN